MLICVANPTADKTRMHAFRKAIRCLRILELTIFSIVFLCTRLPSKAVIAARLPCNPDFPELFLSLTLVGLSLGLLWMFLTKQEGLVGAEDRTFLKDEALVVTSRRVLNYRSHRRTRHKCN